jgi:hypothetical protein
MILPMAPPPDRFQGRTSVDTRFQGPSVLMSPQKRENQPAWAGKTLRMKKSLTLKMGDRELNHRKVEEV